MATNATTNELPALHWTNLELGFAVGDRWRFDDGETWRVDAIFHNGIERAAVCTLESDGSVARFPISAMVRTADKLEARDRRAA